MFFCATNAQTIYKLKSHKKSIEKNGRWTKSLDNISNRANHLAFESAATREKKEEEDERTEIIFIASIFTSVAIKFVLIVFIFTYAIHVVCIHQMVCIYTYKRAAMQFSFFSCFFFFVQFYYQSIKYIYFGFYDGTDSHRKLHFTTTVQYMKSQRWNMTQKMFAFLYAMTKDRQRPHNFLAKCKKNCARIHIHWLTWSWIYKKYFMNLWLFIMSSTI